MIHFAVAAARKSAALLLLLLIAALSRGAATASVTNVEARVTFTNTVRGVTNGDTITVNGDVRRYTNGVLNAPATWIQSTNTVGWAATNTWLHLGTYSPLGVINVFPTNTSNIVIVGSFQTNTFLSVSVSAGVGTVAYSTQVWAETRPVVHPNGSVATEAGRTNNVNGLLSLLNDNRVSNAVPASSPLFTNHLNQFAQQQASNKLFFTTTNRGGAVESAGRISGSNVGLTNGFTVAVTNINSVSSNHVNFGNALRSEGAEGGTQLGSNAQARGSASLAIGNDSLASNSISPVIGAMAVGNGAVATNQSAMAVGNQSLAGAVTSIALGAAASALGQQSVALGAAASVVTNSSVAIGASAVADKRFAVALGSGATTGIGDGAIAIGLNATATNTSAVAIGTAAVSSNANTMVLGSASHRVHVPGFAEFQGGVSNLNTLASSTNIARGSWSYPAFALTTLAAGNNISVPFGTNLYVRFNAGPAGAPTICGAIGGATSGGLDGQIVHGFNDTGFTLTLAVNTVDPVPANRINTPLGTDISIADQGWVFFKYDLTDSRWKVIGTFPLQATATNALTTLMTNGVLVTGAWTNLNILYGTGMVFRATNTAGNVDLHLGATNLLGYTLIGNTAATFSPADSSTYYMGANANVPTTTYDLHTFDVPRAGTLKRVFIKVGAAAGASTEAVSHYIRLNDTTDVTVDTTATYNTAQTNIVNSALSQALVPGDRVALKITTPAWATNPTGVRYYVLLYIE